MIKNFNRQGYEVVAAETRRKNADILMAFDGQGILLTRPEIDTFILVSGDSDFAPLARAIRQKRKRLIVVSSRAVLSRALTEHADIFISLEDCLSGTALNSSFQEMRNPNRRVSVRPSKTKKQPLSALPILRVFLCHSRHDEERVRELYVSLRQQPGIKPWLDREDLFAWSRLGVGNYESGKE